MPEAKAFIDTNVLLYLLSADTAKADRAEAIVRDGGWISVQVLNELVNVARRKLAMPWTEIEAMLTLVRAICPVAPLTVETHDRGRAIAERYGLSVYDAMIVAAALLADCSVLHTEDLQDGLLIDDRLRIRNPFKRSKR
ncbi:MAG: PIN domain-containing protein [Desulfobacteraceae bacterium]|nr:PIN domain-containing protein [Desulfobacteraceae bacterium]